MLTLGGHFSLVLFYLGDERLAYGYIVLEAEHVVNSVPGEILALLEESETLELLVGELILADGVGGLEQSAEHALLSGAATDHVGTDAVESTIEVVEAIVYTVEGTGANDLAEQVEGGIVHDGNVVRVPTDGARHVEHQFGHEEKHGRNLVSYTLGGVEVAGVESDHHVVLGGIGGVEVIGAYSVALETDTEHLGLNTVLHPVILVLKDLIERILEELAIHVAVHGDVLGAVMHPGVHDTGILLSLADGLGNGTATLGVLDPEITDALVGVGEREVAALGMRE